MDDPRLAAMFPSAVPDAQPAPQALLPEPEPDQPAPTDRETEVLRGPDEHADHLLNEAIKQDTMFDGGDPITASEADTHMDGYFQALPDAVGEGFDPEYAAQTRHAMADALEEFGVGSSAVREIGAAAREYVYAADPEKIEAGRTATLAELKKTYGPKYGEVVSDARRAIAEMEKRVPGFTDWLAQTGAGNDLKIIKQAARVGRSMRAATASRVNQAARMSRR